MNGIDISLDLRLFLYGFSTLFLLNLITLIELKKLNRKKKK